MEYPEPDCVGETIIDGILEYHKYDSIDPRKVSHAGCENSEIHLEWGPPLFAPNPSIFVQIHTPELFYFNRTCVLEDIFKFIGGVVMGEFDMKFFTYTYATGVSPEETDYTVLRANFQAFFPDHGCELAFDWFSNFSLLWNRNEDG
eukprot:scpid108948/ scgid34999/ 